MQTPAWKIAVAAADMAMATGAGGADYTELKARVEARFAEQEPRLAMTTEQKGKIARLMAEGIERRIAILKRQGVEPGSKQAAAAMKAAMPKIEAANAELRVAVAKVLSQDQLKTFDEIAEAMRKTIFAELSGAH